MKSLLLPNRLIRPAIICSGTWTSAHAARLSAQRRYKSSNSGASSPGMDADELNPILQDYYKNRPTELQEAISGQGRGATVQQRKLKYGAMPKGSIFGEEELAKPEDEQEPDEKQIRDERKEAEDNRDEFEDNRSLDVVNRVLDPYPHKRWQWERQRIIKDARRGWRLTKSEFLQRTERRSALNSIPLKTSRKKLGALARQISGKSVEEAMLQMRFSKKRTAVEVIKHLEHARDHAIVRWGMGLGEAQGRKGDPITIKLNNGTKRHVTDRTALYIEHAMVRSRPPSLLPEYRARGRINFIKRKWTTLRLVLREEHTRIRESQERLERKARRTPFEPLPDRPITQQRQYVLW